MEDIEHPRQEVHLDDLHTEDLDGGMVVVAVRMRLDALGQRIRIWVYSHVESIESVDCSRILERQISAAGDQPEMEIHSGPILESRRQD